VISRLLEMSYLGEVRKKCSKFKAQILLSYFFKLFYIYILKVYVIEILSLKIYFTIQIMDKLS